MSIPFIPEENALVGAFSVVAKTDGSFAALEICKYAKIFGKKSVFSLIPFVVTMTIVKEC